mmetsp:Transcript_44580/g.87320  ORF Transcript_44580/g.87320 Transcript_44580/m.87320 type:complete len:200 (-) Transcript_44580:1620-2219(-)
MYQSRSASKHTIQFAVTASLKLAKNVIKAKMEDLAAPLSVHSLLGLSAKLANAVPIASSNSQPVVARSTNRVTVPTASARPLCVTGSVAGVSVMLKLASVNKSVKFPPPRAETSMGIQVTASQSTIPLLLAQSATVMGENATPISSASLPQLPRLSAPGPPVNGLPAVRLVVKARRLAQSRAPRPRALAPSLPPPKPAR